MSSSELDSQNQEERKQIFLSKWKGIGIRTYIPTNPKKVSMFNSRFYVVKPEEERKLSFSLRLLFKRKVCCEPGFCFREPLIFQLCLERVSVIYVYLESP